MFIYIIIKLRPVVARGHKVCLQIDWLWVRSPSRRWDIYLHLYFHFFALVSRVKRGVEFRHLTRNASRNWRKVGSVLTLGSLCLLC